MPFLTPAYFRVPQPTVPGSPIAGGMRSCSLAYAWFGIMGIALFEALMTLAVAYTVYWMVLRLSGRLDFAVCQA